MRRKNFALLYAVFFCAVLMRFCVAEAAQTSSPESIPANRWVLISSDQKYGKYYAPANVQIKSAVRGVATCITAWIKTTYTADGAKETIGNYGIEAVIPDPRSLSYSLALVEVYPQTRTFDYVQENFYSPNGSVIWSRVYEPPKSREIEQLAFDEDYYIALVDQIFRHGERDRKNAENRWISLWHTVMQDGSTIASMADTTTMRLSEENLIYWEWIETKDRAGDVVEIKYMKKAVNYSQGTQKILRYRYWGTGATDWEDMTDELDGRYTAIKENSPEYPGLERLRAFVKGYQYWLNRYRTDLPQTNVGAKKATRA